MNTFRRNRVVMATVGSLGDLHPYIALALEMRKRYIEPVIATSEIYRQRIESLNIEFYPNRGAEYLFKRMLALAVRDMYDDLSWAIEDADLLVTHPIVLAGPLVAQTTGIPWGSTELAPGRRSIRGCSSSPPISSR